MRRKFNPRILGALWFMTVLTFIALMVSAAFTLTGYFFARFHSNFPPLAVQIINTLIGLLFTGTAVSIASKIARRKGWVPEMRGFSPIITALEKIAQGDFSIRLDDHFQENQIMGELANTINKMALELNQMENMRQEFISNVSHEIQSPLTSIRGFAQALENDNLSVEERHHYLSIIENESTRLSRITEDLLKLASLEADHVR